MPESLSSSDRRALFISELLPHQEALTAFAYRLSQDAVDAADLVQTTYLKAYRYIHQYEEGTNAKAWLFRILRNSFITEYNRRSRLPDTVDYGEAFLLSDDDHSTVPAFVDLRHELFAHLLGDEVTRAINNLPVNFRLVLLLCDVEDFSYAEISSITDAPIGTVRSRIHRARGLLKEELRSYAKSKGISDKE